jgi:hypothetical protein
VKPHMCIHSIDQKYAPIAHNLADNDRFLGVPVPESIFYLNYYCSHLEHGTFVKHFVLLQFLNLR